MTGVHRLVRPWWTCAIDGLPWPCVEARQLLRETLADDPSVLQRHMTQLMAVAESEIGILGRAALYQRFVEWTLSKGQRCTVCSSPRHAVIAGLPPRLVPCNDVRGLVNVVPCQCTADG